jgi:hypothetical protein
MRPSLLQRIAGGRFVVHTIRQDDWRTTITRADVLPLCWRRGGHAARKGAVLDHLCKNAGRTWEYANGLRQLRVRFRAP